MSIRIDKTVLLGHWDIVEWVQHYDDGRENRPFGEDLKGFLHYDAARVFCFLCAANRSPLSGSQWTAPEAERAQAYSSCLTYSGTYSIAGDEVLHHIDMSLYPNWVGTTQRRKAQYGEGHLTLSARLEDGTPQARTARLVWGR